MIHHLWELHAHQTRLSQWSCVTRSNILDFADALLNLVNSAPHGR